MIEKGQLIYQQNKDGDKTFYDLGIVTEVYDNRIFLKWKYKNHISSFIIEDIKDNIDSDEEGLLILYKDGKPAFAKKSLFGKYKFI
jgi:hypothetical protein